MTNAANVQYHLLSSTRYDDALLSVAWNTRVNDGIPSKFMLLPYHFDRLAAAAEQHGWIASQQRLARDEFTAACDNAVIAAHSEHGNVPLKVSPSYTLLLTVLTLRDPDSDPVGTGWHIHCKRDACNWSLRPSAPYSSL